MATFIRPERVEITEGGNGLAPVAVLAIAGAAVAAVVAFILAHLLLIVAGLIAATAATVVSLRLLRKHATVIDWAPRPQEAIQAATVTAEAIPVTAHPAIEAPQIHQHIHFHGVPAEDIAAIIGQAQARPAIREHLS